MTVERSARLAGRLRSGPTVRWHRGAAEAVAPETLVVPVPVAGEPASLAQDLLAALGIATLDDIPGVRELDAGHGSTWRMPTLGRLPAGELLFVWYGDDPDVRQALAEAAMTAAHLSAGRSPVALVIPEQVDGALDALLQGFHDGSYRHELDAADDAERAPGDLLLVGDGDEPADLAERAHRAALLGAVLGRVRDLVNAPANVLGPMSFAAVARDVALAAGAEAHVWSTDELREGRFAGLLEAGKAGDEPPALVELVHRGADPGAPTVALVGKGITFDSGGYDIKPIGEMARMKCDMAGAAAVLGAIEVAARLALPINILGLLAIAENVLGGNALRPGDVIVHRNGITSEVTNPDAEGRLVLADALAYAAEQRPAAIVEVSTLVGPPLGSDLWGLVASDDALAERLLEAGRAVSDPGWRLPLWRRYRRHISSPIADQRNSTQSLDYPIAVISSALFLDRFVPREIPWAHIDIGATAAREGGTASPAWPVGATGSPMRALVAWLAGRYDPTGVG